MNKQQDSNRFRETSDQVEIFAQLMKSQSPDVKESAEEKELNKSREEMLSRRKKTA